MTVNEVPGHGGLESIPFNKLIYSLFIFLFCWFFLVKQNLIADLNIDWSDINTLEKIFWTFRKPPAKTCTVVWIFFLNPWENHFYFFLGKNPGFVLKCSTMHNLNRITSHHPRITGITIYWQCTPAQTFSRRFFQMSWTAKYDQKTITNGLCRIDFPWKYILKIDNLTKRGWCCVGSFTTGF